MRKGFTLVELSIVMVIIGLLIGGILVGRSMVNASKVSATVKTLQELDASIEAFKIKYGFLPGDIKGMPQTVCCRQSDEDGLVMWGGELGFFWHDLSIGVGLKNKAGENYPPFVAFNESSSPGLEGIYTPMLPIDRNTTQLPLLRVFTSGPATGWDGSRNYYQYSMPGKSYGDGWATLDITTPSDSSAVDKKLDDGKPHSGNFLAAEWANQMAQNRCTDGVNYKVAEKGFHCSWNILLQSMVKTSTRP